MLINVLVVCSPHPADQKPGLLGWCGCCVVQIADRGGVGGGGAWTLGAERHRCVAWSQSPPSTSTKAQQCLHTTVKERLSQWVAQVTGYPYKITQIKHP